MYIHSRLCIKVSSQSGNIQPIVLDIVLKVFAKGVDEIHLDSIPSILCKPTEPNFELIFFRLCFGAISPSLLLPFQSHFTATFSFELCCFSLSLPPLSSLQPGFLTLLMFSAPRAEPT